MPLIDPVDDLLPSGRIVRARVGALDGLRGFAVLAVLACHLVVHFDLTPVGRGGFIGVLVFFVLSGYLITKICWRDDGSWRGYAAFVRRRAVRLMPALAGLVVGGLAVSLLVAREAWEPASTRAALAVSQLTAFGVVWGDGMDAPWGPTWSLTVEWTFYLLWPLGIIALKRLAVDTRTAMVVAAGGAVLLYCLGLLLSDLAFYVLPAANLGAMLAGAAVALRHAGAGREPKPLVSTGPAALAVGFLFAMPLLPLHTLGPGYRFVVFPTATLLSVIAIDACRRPSGFSAALAWRPLRYAGVRAYSTYLWHMPVFWACSIVMADFPPYAMAAAGMVVLLPVVAASFRYLERPWLEVGSQRLRADSTSTSRPLSSPARDLAI